MLTHRIRPRALRARSASSHLARVVVLVSCVVVPALARAQTFQLSYPAAANAGPITGRAFLFVARTDKEEPRLQAGASATSEPFFGVDVEALAAGKRVTHRSDRARLPASHRSSNCRPVTTSCRG